MWICHKNGLFRGRSFLDSPFNGAGRRTLPRCSSHLLCSAAAEPRIIRWFCLKFQFSFPDDYSHYCPKSCMVPPLKAPPNTFLPDFVHGHLLAFSQPASQYTTAHVHRPAPDDYSHFCPKSCIVPPLKSPPNTFLPIFVHGCFLTRREESRFTVLLASGVDCWKLSLGSVQADVPCTLLCGISHCTLPGPDFSDDATQTILCDIR